MADRLAAPTAPTEGVVRTVRRSLRLIRDDGRHLGGLLALGVAASTAEAIGALLLFVVFRAVSDPGAGLTVPGVGDLYARYPSVEADTVLVWFCAGAGLFFLVRGAILLLQAKAQYRAAYGVAASLCGRLVERYLRRDYALHLRKDAARLTQAAFDAVNIVSTYALVPTLVAGSEAIVVVALLLVLVVKAPWLTGLAIVVVGGLLLASLRFVQPRLAALGEERQRATVAVYRLIHQSLDGAREVRLQQAQPYFLDRLEADRRGLAASQQRQATLSAMPRLVLETVFAGFILVFVAGAAAGNRLSPDTIGLLGLFAYAVVRIMPSVNRISVAANSLRYSAASLAVVEQELAAPAEGHEHGSDWPCDERVILRDRLELRNVTYRYPDQDVDVLKDVSISIPRGSSIGLVGPTGAGKSTLVDIVLGLLVPSAGQVLVDGEPLDGRVGAWRGTLGVVSQSIFLIDDTLRRNAAFGVPDELIDDARVREAVDAARLGGFVDTLPDGLDTLIGERGVRLSGGQRQRLAIARALYRQPQVVVFDEGTSALDSLTETEVLDALEERRGDCTLIVVAHRLTSVRRCDRVVVLGDGRISDEGTYDELLGRNAGFRQMAT